MQLSCCDSPAVPALRVLKPIYWALFSLSPCDLGTSLISLGSGARQNFLLRRGPQDRTTRLLPTEHWRCSHILSSICCCANDTWSIKKKRTSSLRFEAMGLKTSRPQSLLRNKGKRILTLEDVCMRLIKNALWLALSLYFMFTVYLTLPWCLFVCSCSRWQRVTRHSSKCKQILLEAVNPSRFFWIRHYSRCCMVIQLESHLTHHLPTSVVSV